MLDQSVTPQTLAATGETTISAKVNGAEYTIAGLRPDSLAFIAAVAISAGVVGYIIGKADR